MPKSGNGARAKLRRYFLENIGRILTSNELREAAGGVNEWARRIRELRDEEGFQIQSHNDSSNLRSGEYLLTDPKPTPAFARSISKETRAFVLDRNGFTCQMCGAAAGEPHFQDPRRKTRLHIGHIVDKSLGGSDDVSNLRAICSVCNEGASNITPTRPEATKLLVQIRRAKIEDQRRVLEWLEKKFRRPS
jgi:hypothetical protein